MSRVGVAVALLKSGRPVEFVAKHCRMDIREVEQLERESSFDKRPKKSLAEMAAQARARALEVAKQGRQIDRETRAAARDRKREERERARIERDRRIAAEFPHMRTADLARRYGLSAARIDQIAADAGVVKTHEHRLQANRQARGGVYCKAVKEAIIHLQNNDIAAALNVLEAADK